MSSSGSNFTDDEREWRRQDRRADWLALVGLIVAVAALVISVVLFVQAVTP